MTWFHGNSSGGGTISAPIPSINYYNITHSSTTSGTIPMTSTGTIQGNSIIIGSGNYSTSDCSIVYPLKSYTTATEHAITVNKSNKGESSMCETLIVLAITLLIGYIIGRGWDWRYKIVIVRSGVYEVWFKPALWPFWFDHGPCYYSIDEAKAGLNICKSHGKPVEV